MKLLIAKETTESRSDEFVNEFLENTKSQFDTEIIFFDVSLNKEPKDLQGKFAVVDVDYEDRNNINLMAMSAAFKNQFDAVLFFDKRCSPGNSIVDKLFEHMEDTNIDATYSDYSVDGVPMIQNKPVVICRRARQTDNDMYDLEKCEGIVKYIPLNLYDIKT